MDMTSYFLGRNAAGNSSSGADFNIVEPATDKTFEDTDIYNANGMNVVINGILEMIDEIEPTLSDLVAESISDCERTYNKTKYIDINSGENLYPDAKAVYEYGQRIAQSRQEILVSGENIKTINGQSVLGKGDIPIGDGGSGEIWEHICDIEFVTDEEVTVVKQDLGAEYRKLLLYVNKDSAGGLTSGGGDSYDLSIKSGVSEIARVINSANKGWVVHTFIIEWIPGASKVISRHTCNSNTAGTDYACNWSKPITELSFHTDGTLTSGTICTFGNFTMNVYGVRV